MKGLLAISDGERELAIHYFEASQERPFVNVDHYWGKAILSRLYDPKWELGK